jgi:hypothetical protein
LLIDINWPGGVIARLLREAVLSSRFADSLSVGRMNAENILVRFFGGGNSYWLTRFVILRLLGFVYAIAFLVATQQLVPLIGEHGLTPANHFLASIQSQLGSSSAGMLRLPTLFWFGLSNN